MSSPVDVSPLTTSALKPLNTTGLSTQQRLDRFEKAAEGFEALFLQEMMKSARATSLGDDLFGSSGVEMQQSLLDTELTSQSAGRTGFGLARAIYEQFAAHVPGAGKRS